MATFTLAHVVISLVAIASGLAVLFGMLAAKRLNGCTAFFLTTTVATSATGFGFPFERLLPSHIVGILSLVVLAIAIYARYVRQPPFLLAQGTLLVAFIILGTLAAMRFQDEPVHTS